MNRPRPLTLLLACALAAVAAPAVAQQPNPCGPLANHYGPFDYRLERDDKLRIVERSHFTPQVEALIRGQGSAYLQQDLNYVLRTAPNHHRALLSTIRMGARLKTTWVPMMDYSIECWLERAVRFAPDDTVARALYAQYLGSIKKAKQGVQVLDEGLEHAKDNPLSTYNFGLIYFELGDTERALKQAHRALELGDTRPQLADLLKRAGKWREPGP